MATARTRPNEIVDLRTSTGQWAKSATILESEPLEVIRLMVPAGKRIPMHAAAGDLLIHCLDGKLTLMALGRTQELCAGQLVYLPAREPHALTGIEDAALLLTIIATPLRPYNGGDLVDEASRESFPASDPPARTPVVGS